MHETDIAGTAYGHCESDGMSLLPDKALAPVKLECVISRVPDELFTTGEQKRERNKEELTATVIHEVMSMFGGEEDDILFVRPGFALSFRSNREVIGGDAITRKGHASRPTVYILPTALSQDGVSDPSSASHPSRLAELIAGDLKCSQGLSRLIEGLC